MGPLAIGLMAVLGGAPSATPLQVAVVFDGSVVTGAPVAPELAPTILANLAALESGLREPGGKAEQVYRAEVARRDPDRLRSKGRAALGLDALYGGAAVDHQDTLLRLAEGRIRPSEVDARDLPGFLRGAALEPLLDELWAFVDARRLAGGRGERRRGARVPRWTPATVGGRRCRAGHPARTPPRALPSLIAAPPGSRRGPLPMGLPRGVPALTGRATVAIRLAGR